MKAIALLSGGKDSFFSTLIAMEQGMEIVKCLTVKPDQYSEMFHVPNSGFANEVARLLGLETEFVGENNFYGRLEEIAKSLKAEAVISGAIASNFQKTRIERFCTENNLLSFTPLWLMDQEKELGYVLQSGILPMIVSVSAEGLGKKDLGRLIGHSFIKELLQIKEKIGINVAGEGGEYESFVIGFNSRRLIIKEYEDIEDGSMSYRKIIKIESAGKSRE